VVEHRFFRPVEAEDGALNVYLVSDRPEELTGWLTMRLQGFGGEEIWRETVAAAAPPGGSRIVHSIPADSLLAGADRSRVVFSAEFDCPGERAAREIRYFVRPADMDLPAGEISVEAAAGRSGASLTLTSEVLQKNVFLQLEGGGRFSYNFFDMLPGDMVTVFVEADIPAGEIPGKLRIRTLRDTY
jgi:beta-mannosidase